MDRTRVVRRKIGCLLTLAALLACGCQTVKTPEEKIAKSNIPRGVQQGLDARLRRRAARHHRRRGPRGPARPADHRRAAGPARRQDLARLLRRGLRRRPDHRPRSRKRSSSTSASTSTTRCSASRSSTTRTASSRRSSREDSNRVFVDVTSYNSKVYYVQGDVGVPGQLPITGNETVLDAINYAGGLIPTASTVEHPAGPARPAGCLLRADSCRSTSPRSSAPATRRPTTSSCPATAWSSTATRSSGPRSSSTAWPPRSTPS